MVPFRIRVVDTYIDCDKSGFYFYWIFFGATSLTAWGNSIKMMYLMASALRHTRCGFATRSNHDEKWISNRITDSQPSNQYDRQLNHSKNVWAWKKIPLLLVLCKFLQDLHKTTLVNIMFHSEVKAQVECFLSDYSSSITVLTSEIRYSSLLNISLGRNNSLG